MALDNLRNITNALEQFDFEQELIHIVDANESTVVDLQAEQLSHGVNSAGQQINPPYAESTIEYKRKHGRGLGSITDRVTFYMTGELYQSLRAQVVGGKYEITSPLDKFGYMIKRSGEWTIGLSDEYRERFIDGVTRPEIARIVNEKLGLQITRR